MTDEKTPLSTPNYDSSFYTGQEVSTGDVASSGISRRILHGLTIISIIGAGACTAYGAVQTQSAVLVLPILIVLMWLFLHVTLIVFAKNDQHNFSPPSWFIFFSSAQIFMQSITVMILTIYKKPT